LTGYSTLLTPGRSVVQARAMVVGLVYSIKDLAGSGIAEVIREWVGAERAEVPGARRAWSIPSLNAVMAEYEEDIIYVSGFEKVVDGVEYIVYLSRHSSAAGVPSLTTHHTGVPRREALAGGRPLTLSIANPPVAYTLLMNLFREAERAGLEGFEITYEVTHHGPTDVSVPLTFVEIGSKEEQWVRRDAREVVASAVIDLLREGPRPCTPSTGFGGPHYAGPFTQRSLRYGECFGHIVPRYAIKELLGDEGALASVVRQALTRSLPQPVKAVVLKKVQSSVKKVIAEIAESLGIGVVVA